MMDKQEILKQVKLFVLDMDGTFYLGDEIIPGSLEFIEMVKKSGRDYIFFTNNSSKNKQLYIEKLAGMGLNITKDKIMTSGDVTIQYLKTNYPGKSVFLLGTPALEEQFMEAGILLTNPMPDKNGNETNPNARELADESELLPGERPDIVVVGFDKTLTYHKLERACTYIRNGSIYLATHPDINCPTADGFIPDTGAMIACINRSTTDVPLILGKPNRDTMDMVVSATGYKPSEIAFVGDRLYTDVATGVKNGGLGLLVLSGETRPEDLENLDDLDDNVVFPDGVYENLYEIGSLLN